jgi:hypothetical protein
MAGRLMLWDWAPCSSNAADADVGGCDFEETHEAVR